MGWKIYGEYVDTGFSGSTDKRPQLAKILTDARRRRFDCLIVWKLDRFGRSVSNFVRHMEDLTAWGVRFLTITQQIDTDQANPTSRLLMHIFAAFAEFERAMISERVKAGMKAAKYRGAKLGRKRLVLDREVVREKAGAMRLLGKSTRQIAVELGVSKGTLHRLLAA
jgi:putative DNA-invertase from lambdoid prophage Rac